MIVMKTKNKTIKRKPENLTMCICMISALLFHTIGVYTKTNLDSNTYLNFGSPYVFKIKKDTDILLYKSIQEVIPKVVTA